MTTFLESIQPKTLDDCIGQQHLIGPNTLIRTWVENPHMPMSNICLYGGAGIGKTTIARIIASSRNTAYTKLNATNCTKKQLTDALETHMPNGGIVFIDEIHRLTAPLQDVLLPYMEHHSGIVIGATTENPYHSRTTSSAIRSRMMLMPLYVPTLDEMRTYIVQTIERFNAYHTTHVTIDENALQQFTHTVQNDVRKATNVTYQACLFAQNVEPTHITVDMLHTLLPDAHMHDDNGTNTYYNVLSALQKSIRGSDADASVYYAARLLQMGELESAVRRITVTAYEDIGLHDNEAVRDAVEACTQALHMGLPEARIPISYAVIRLALAPKSNHAYEAINAALTHVKKHHDEIPVHLHDGHYAGAQDAKNIVGAQYLYPHAYPYAIVKQHYQPSTLTPTTRAWIPLTKTEQPWEKRLHALRHYLQTP